jgi:hypothetical protein
VVVDVNGTGFISTTKVLVDLVAVQTTYVSATKVTTNFLGALSTAKTYTVQVQNPNEEPSNSKPYVVAVTPPSTSTVTSLAPNTASASGGVTIDVNGTAFKVGAVVLANGLAVQTTYVSATKLTTNYFATNPNEGTYQVGMKNPNEQQTNTLPFTLTEVLPNIPLTGLFGWWDAARDSSFVAGTTGKITQWKDRNNTAARTMTPFGGTEVARGGSLSGNKFVSTTSAIHMGVDTSPTSLPATNMCVFMAVRTPSTRGACASWAHTALYLAHHVAFTTAAQHTYDSGRIDAGPETLNQWQVMSYVRDSTTLTMRRDGVALTLSNPSGGQASTSGVSIGIDSSSTGIRNPTDMAELIVYNRLLNGTEITQVETYLRDKWFGVGKPGAPTLMTTTSGDTQVALTWTAPAYIGSGAITDYAIQRSTDGVTWTNVTKSVSTALSYTVTGLTNDVGQYFQVAAVNATGTSQWSKMLYSIPGPWPKTGLMGWWDASDAASITATGGSVSQWNDKTGGGYHMTQATGAAQPKTGVTTVNGRNAIQFDGVDDAMRTSTFLPTGIIRFAMFFVVRADGAQSAAGGYTPFAFMHGDGLGGAGLALLLAYNTVIGAVHFQVATMAGTSTAPTSGTHLMSLVRTGGTSSLRYDTVQEATSTSVPPTPSGFACVGGVSPTYLKGSVCEAMIYAIPPNDAERLQLESYFRTKWGTP